MKYTTKNSQSYTRMTSSVAEKFVALKDTIQDQFIPWDEFTESWVMDKLPKPKTYEDEIYKKLRTNYWVKDINDYLRYHEYPYRLNVVYGKGVKFQAIGVVRTRIRYRQRQHKNFLKRTLTENTEMLKAPFSPMEKGLLSGYNSILSGVDQMLDSMQETILPENE